MTSAFVTGGSGFIGGALIERLGREGWAVRALARSDGSAARVSELGAEPVRGDLEDRAALEAGAAGCEVVLHCAAKVDDWGEPEEFERRNVYGTQNALDASIAAGVRRFVHTGTEAALSAGQALVRVDEDAPLRPDSPILYAASKAAAEQRVRAANGNGIETVVIRPRFVWGRGDTTLLPALVELVESGRFRWIGGGRHLTDTTNVANTVEGLWLGTTKAPAGGVYFVTDGAPVVFREFVTSWLGTQGVTAPEKTIPTPVADAAAATAERAWRLMRRPGSPPLTRMAVWASSRECTLDISRAQRELGYRPVISLEQGLAELGS
jgi:nucleoside-diphosphate-sugar epimerase